MFRDLVVRLGVANVSGFRRDMLEAAGSVEAMRGAVERGVNPAAFGRIGESAAMASKATTAEARVAQIAMKAQMASQAEGAAATARISTASVRSAAAAGRQRAEMAKLSADEVVASRLRELAAVRSADLAELRSAEETSRSAALARAKYGRDAATGQFVTKSVYTAEAAAAAATQRSVVAENTARNSAAVNAARSSAAIAEANLARARVTEEAVIRETSALGRLRAAYTATVAGAKRMASEHGYAVRSMGFASLLLGGILLAAFGEAAKVASDFQGKMLNVASITNGGAKAVAGLNDEVLQLSRVVPVGPVKLADALYQIASAGKFGEQGLQILRVSATAASAGLADVTQTAIAITSVLNAYGYQVQHAAYISDVLFQTVKVGIVTFEQLTQQLGDFVAFGAIAGIKIEDLGIAMSIITRAGVPAAEASTSLNRVIQGLIKPSADLSKAMGELGFKNSAQALSMKLSAAEAAKLNAVFKEGGSSTRAIVGESLGLVKTMELLRVHSGGDVQTIQKYFKEIRAGRGAYAFMADGGRLAAEVVKEFGNHNDIAGQTVRALNIQSQGMGYQFKLVKSNLQDVGITLGQRVIPFFTKLATGLSDTAQGFSRMSPGTQDFIQKAGLMGGLVATFGGALLVVVPRIAAMASALGTLGLAEGAVTVASRLMLASFGIIGVALAVGAYLLYEHGKAAAADAAQIDKYKQALSETNTALDDVNKGLASSALGNKVLDTLNTYGQSVDTVTAGVLGNMKQQKVAASGLADALVKLYDPKSQRVIGARVYVPNIDNVEKQAARVAELRKEVTKAVGGDATAAASLGMGLDHQSKAYRTLESAIVAISRQTRLHQQAVAENKKTLEATNPVLNTSGHLIKGMSDASLDAKGNLRKLDDEEKALQKTTAGLVSAQAAWTSSQANLTPMTTAVDDYNTVLKANQKALDKAASAQAKAYNAALDAGSKAARAQSAATKLTATDESNAFKQHVQDVEASQQHLSRQQRQQGRDAIAAARQHARDIKAAASEQSKAIVAANSAAHKSAKDFAQKATVYVGQLATQMFKSAADQAKFRANIDTLYRRGVPSGLVDSIAAAGKDGEGVAKLLAASSEKSLDRVVQAYKKSLPKAGASFDEFTMKMDEKLKHLKLFQKNLETIAAKGFGDLAIKIGTELDPEAAATLAADAVKRTQAQLTHLNDTWAKADAATADQSAMDQRARLKLLDQLSSEASSKTFNLADFANNTAHVGIYTVLDDLRTLGSRLKLLPKEVQVQIRILTKDENLISTETAKHTAINKHADTVSQNLVDATHTGTAAARQASQRLAKSELPEIKREADQQNARVVAAATKAKAQVDKIMAGGALPTPVKVAPKLVGPDVLTILGLDKTYKIKIVPDLGNLANTDIGTHSHPSLGGKFSPPTTKPIPVPRGFDTGGIMPRVYDQGGITPRAYAYGGITTNNVITHKYAYGVLPKDATIQSPKTLVQWAEPGTGGEAFIPMSPARRARSSSILQTVANRFGYQLTKTGNGGGSNARAASVGGTQMMSSSRTPVVHVHMPKDTTPHSRTHVTKYEFPGMIVQPANFDDFVASQTRRARVSALAGGSDYE